VSVLVVDDDPDFADLTSTYLARHEPSLEVTVVHSAREALDRLTTERFDCVVSDYDMPEMDGLAFLEAVDDLDPDLPFVLFTGKGSEDIASRAISAGVTDYLQKKGGREQYELLANRVVHAARDRRARRAAEGTEAHLRTILESATDAVLTIDESSTVRFANAAVEAVFGYTPDEVVGEPLTMLMPERLRDEHLRSIRQYAENGERGVDWTALELTGRHRDGHELTLSVSFGEFVRAGQRYFTGIVRDISAQRARQRELAVKDRALDEAATGVVLTDPSRPDNPIVYANRRFETLTGYTLDEVVGRNCRFLQGPETDSEPVAALRDAIDAERPVTVELVNYRKDGTPFWNRVHVTPLRTDDGTVTHFLGHQQDVTERRDVESGLAGRDRVVERPTDVVWMVDTDGVLLALDQRLLTRLAVDREAALGRHVTEVLDSPVVVDGPDEFGRAVEAVLGGARDRLRLEVTLAEGSTTTVHAVELVPLHAGQAVVGAVGFDTGLADSS
jgi:PAS domain S-box-containing protein